MSVFVSLLILICNFCYFYEYIAFETRQIYNRLLRVQCHSTGEEEEQGTERIWNKWPHSHHAENDQHEKGRNQEYQLQRREYNGRAKYQ